MESMDCEDKVKSGVSDEVVVGQVFPPPSPGAKTETTVPLGLWKDENMEEDEDKLVKSEDTPGESSSTGGGDASVGGGRMEDGEEERMDETVEIEKKKNQQRELDLKDGDVVAKFDNYYQVVLGKVIVEKDKSTSVEIMRVEWDDNIVEKISRKEDDQLEFSREVGVSACIRFGIFGFGIVYITFACVHYRLDC